MNKKLKMNSHIWSPIINKEFLKREINLQYLISGSFPSMHDFVKLSKSGRYKVLDGNILNNLYNAIFFIFYDTCPCLHKYM